MSDFQLVDTVETATIGNGTSLSAAVDLGGCRVCAIQMPAGWTTASMTFAASATYGGTYAKVRDKDNNELTITSPAVNEVIYLDPALLAGIRYLKVRSGTASSAVNQGGDRAVVLLTRPL